MNNGQGWSQVRMVYIHAASIYSSTPDGDTIRDTQPWQVGFQYPPSNQKNIYYMDIEWIFIVKFCFENTNVKTWMSINVSNVLNEL